MADIDFGGAFKLLGSSPGIITFGDAKGVFMVSAEVKAVIPDDPKLRPEEITKMNQEAQAHASYLMAVKARNRMAAWFNPKSNHYVGVGSKATAAGIYVPSQPENNTPGQALYMVKERRDSLRLIREGLAPGSKGPHRKKRMMEWLNEKEISDDGFRRKSEEEERKSTMYRIQNYIYQYGMSDYWAEHVGPAGGRRFFNYPQYYRNNYGIQDAQSVMEAMFMDRGGRSGYHAILTGMVLGSLSTADFQRSGKAHVNVKRVHMGSSGKYRRVWDNLDRLVLGTEAEADAAYQYLDERAVNYAGKLRKRIGKAKIKRIKSTKKEKHVFDASKYKRGVLRKDD